MILPSHEGDLFEWKAYIKGPRDTPYEEGVFELFISIPQTYPLRPPNVKFVTKIFHPNIHFKTGEICLDILKGAWSAVYTLESVCRSIIALLEVPEADSPLNCDCGNLIRAGDDKGFASMAKMYVLLFASASLPAYPPLPSSPP